MGMFDRLIGADGHEWQTKAFDCNLDRYEVGDVIKSEFPATYPMTYQVETLGATEDDPYTDSYATVRNGRLRTGYDERDERLPLINYDGYLIHMGAAQINTKES